MFLQNICRISTYKWSYDLYSLPCNQMDNFSSLEYGPLHPVKGMTDAGKLGWNPLLIIFTGLKTILSLSSCKLLNIFFFSPASGEKVYKIKRISFSNFDQQDSVCFSRLTLCYLPPVTKFYRNQTKCYFRSLTHTPITVIKEYHHYNKKKNNSWSQNHHTYCFLKTTGWKLKVINSVIDLEES